MKRAIIGLCAALLLLAGVAIAQAAPQKAPAAKGAKSQAQGAETPAEAAQTPGEKMTETAKCEKADQEYSLPIAGQKNHSFSISHTKCTYTKPGQIAGIETKDGEDTISAEVRGTHVFWHGFYVENMANGDQAYYRHHGQGLIKNGVFSTGTDDWVMVRGTGKLKGYKGKGTCKIIGADDGSATDECSGEYTAPH
jgi:hypothetical protein